MLNVFLLFANTFLRLLLFLAALIPQLLQKSRFFYNVVAFVLRKADFMVHTRQQSYSSHHYGHDSHADT